LARAHGFDVVFLDIGLPDIDGYEFARRLRREVGLRDVLLVALSGYGGADDRNRSRAGWYQYPCRQADGSERARQVAIGASPQTPPLSGFRAEPR